MNMLYYKAIRPFLTFIAHGHCYNIIYVRFCFAWKKQ